MAKLMRQHDWSETPLGCPSTWPDGLTIPLRMLLTSRFEMWLGWGEDLRFFYNDAYIPTLGIKHPSMLGRPFREVWAEVYDDVADQVAKVRAGEATWNESLMLILERSGYPEETYHSFSYSPLYGAERAVEGLLCIVTEVTRPVISDRRLSTLRQLGTALVGVTSRDEVSLAVCAVLGANRRDFPFALLFLGDGSTRQAVACSADAAHLLNGPWPDDPPANGISFALPPDVDYPAGDWPARPREALSVPIPGAAGRPAAGFLILGLNPFRQRGENVADLANLLAGQISGALANVATLATERRRADRIWTNSRDLLVTVDAAGVFQSVSPSWTRILKHPIEAVVGRSFSDFIHPDDLEPAHQALRKAMSGSYLTGLENRFQTADGEVRHISWNTAMEDGLVYGYGRDVTEEKAKAAALANAEEALRHAQKMEAVGQLTGGIAHDFNNLLTGIIGSLDLVRRRIKPDWPSDVDRFLTVATSSAERAASLTQRLLAFARRQSLDPQPVQAHQLVVGMLDLIKKSIGELIVLRIETEEDLWNARCDPNQLESSVLNLAINSRDAMPDGGTLTIRTENVRVEPADLGRVALPAPGDYVLLQVEDTGHGMPAHVISKAFEPFFTTKPLGKGTGLGLSMIYGFAQQSGGTVLIESVEQQGTVVSLYIPRSREDARPIVPAGGDADRAEAIKHAATILIVEDEPAVRLLVTESLGALGYETLVASTGPDGLRILQSDQSIDLLLTDVGLPGLNGRQLADAARVTRPNLKILFVTGYVHDSGLYEDGLEPGMAVVTKPFDIDKLAKRVAELIRQ